ncbi:MAG TPA: MerR family transcriptional regulator [Candidatus Luteococcus avicola]|nr:MerR family transcriptional regulator [Candidatus Luteococcus avicola]
MNEELEQALRLARDPPGGVSIAALEGLVRDDPTTWWDIAEAADRLDVTTHALRYYERIGMVGVPRDAAGHRRYDSPDIRRLVFIGRMRMAGMPIADLQKNLYLVEAGPHAIGQWLGLMLEHRGTLRRQISQLQLALAATEYKIATYHEGPTDPPQGRA